MGSLTNIIFAVILATVTLAVAYVTWYVVYGRSLKIRKMNAESEEGEETQGRKPAKGDGKYDRKSYCYPSINDDMGYEFVTVQKIPDFLLKKEKVKAEEETPSWDETSGTGLSAVSSRGNDNDEEDGYYGIEEETGEGNKLPDKPQRENGRNDSYSDDDDDGMDEHIGDSELEKHDEIVTVLNINADELEQISNWDWGNDEQDEEISDEQLSSIVANNPGQVEFSGTDNENARLILEQKQMMEDFDMERFLMDKDVNDEVDKEQEDILNGIDDYETI